jgi:hypothetical protein
MACAMATGVIGCAATCPRYEDRGWGVDDGQLSLKTSFVEGSLPGVEAPAAVSHRDPIGASHADSWCAHRGPPTVRSTRIVSRRTPAFGGGTRIAAALNAADAHRRSNSETPDRIRSIAR